MPPSESSDSEDVSGAGIMPSTPTRENVLRLASPEKYQKKKKKKKKKKKRKGLPTRTVYVYDLDFDAGDCIYDPMGSTTGEKMLREAIHWETRGLKVRLASLLHDKGVSYQGQLNGSAAICPGLS